MKIKNRTEFEKLTNTALRDDEIDIAYATYAELFGCFGENIPPVKDSLIIEFTICSSLLNRELKKNKDITERLLDANIKLSNSKIHYQTTGQTDQLDEIECSIADLKEDYKEVIKQQNYLMDRKDRLLSLLSKS
jgi:hypothetical protein